MHVCANSKIDKAAVFFAAILWTLAAPLSAQEQSSIFGNFFYSLSPKALKDGSMLDAALGYQYSPRSAGTLRLRFSNTAKNEQFDESLEDSLNAIEDSSFEVFLIPFEWTFLKSPALELRAGAGVYYDYYTLREKGFFSMPELEALGKERVNSFSNDFAMHIIGPSVTLGFGFQWKWLALAVNGGVAPVFYLNARQKMGVAPLLDPHNADYTQETAGSPYIYADMSVTLFKYVSLAFLYDYSRLDYKVIDFNDQLKWHTPERETVSQSLKLEVSARIPLGGSVLQIGYGRTFDSTRVDSAPLIKSGRDYLILTTKTIR